MKKTINKWMISTVVVSLLSVIVIGVLVYKLNTQPEMGGGPNGEQPSDMQMPEDGQRPDQQGNGGPPQNQTTNSSSEEDSVS